MARWSVRSLAGTLVALVLLGLRFDLCAQTTKSLKYDASKEMQVLFRLDGELPQDRFGAHGAALGDLNGDGIPDFAVSASGTAPQRQRNQGSVFLASGKDGKLIRRLDGPVAHANLGSWVNAAGDVDGDGVLDLLVSSPNATVNNVREAGTLYLFSGANGAVLHRFSGNDTGIQWGNQGACAGDVNGDGTLDIIAGTIRYNRNTGCVFIYSGRDGSVLHELYGTVAGSIFGHGVDGAGDVNGDGKADVIVGAPGKPGPGVATVFSGADGSVLFTFKGERENDGLGHRVAGGRDLNGDGTPDFVVSASGWGRNDAGMVYAYSGKDGSLLWQLVGETKLERLGYGALRAIPDVNGDGKEDVVVGAWSAPGGGASPGRAYVLSGVDGSLLAYFDEKLPGGHVDMVDYVGDVNGDGKPEFLIGAGYIDRPELGHAYVVTANLSVSATPVRPGPVPPQPGPGRPGGNVQLSESRRWQDMSGAYSVQARLVEVQAGDVVLDTSDGRRIKVPIAKLCPADQQFIKAQRPTGGESTEDLGSDLE
jgi:hypothetical protein